MNFKEAFGQHLKGLRKSKKITQEKLSELIGIHPRQVSKIETGDHFPTSSTIESLCYQLEVEPRELFAFDLINKVQYAKTGTGTTYNYTATVKNNVVYLHDVQKNITHAQKASSDGIDEEMFDVAKNTKRSVIVQYVYDDGSSKTIEYFPNRTFQILDSANKHEVDLLLDNIKEKLQDKQYLDFIKLAVNSLDNADELNKLEMLIAGIKLAHKNK